MHAKPCGTTLFAAKAATRQRSNNRLPLYRSGSVRPTRRSFGNGRSEASIQPPLHPPHTSRRLSVRGNQAAFSSSLRSMYVGRIIAPSAPGVKPRKTKVFVHQTLLVKQQNNARRKSAFVRNLTAAACRPPLLENFIRLSESSLRGLPGDPSGCR